MTKKRITLNECKQCVNSVTSLLNYTTVLTLIDPSLQRANSFTYNDSINTERRIMHNQALQKSNHQIRKKTFYKTYLAKCYTK